MAGGGTPKLSDQQFVPARTVTLKPSTLAGYAADRDSDLAQKMHVRKIAGEINRKGYTRPDDPEKDLKLVKTDTGTFLWEGNHRVEGMEQIHYDKRVPVVVYDYRTQR